MADKDEHEDRRRKNRRDDDKDHKRDKDRKDKDRDEPKRPKDDEPKPDKRPKPDPDGGGSGPAVPPGTWPIPVPEGATEVDGDPQRAIDLAKPGDVLDFGWQRWTHDVPLIVPAIEDLTFCRLFDHSPLLTPDEPNLWAKRSRRLRFLACITIGSPEVGKWSHETGNKQHGYMLSNVLGVELYGCLVASVGGDWLQFTDKGGSEPGSACADAVVTDTILWLSRRQGISLAGLEGGRFTRIIAGNAQRTLIDAESEGGGASDIAFEDCDFDCFTRQPNFFISIGGAKRPGFANEGPFAIRKSRIYGLGLTHSNRSQAELLLEDNGEGVEPRHFPDLRLLLEQRYPGVADLADLAGVADGRTP